jgi:hypothetical protein
MQQLELAVAVLVGIYWTWAVVAALQAGVVGHRQARHSRADEPKTYWLTIAWYAALAIMCLTAAVHFWEGLSR